MDILIIKSTGLRFLKLSTKVNKIVYKIMVVSILKESIAIVLKIICQQSIVIISGC